MVTASMATNTAIGNRERSGEGNFLSFIVSLKNFELQISVYFFNLESQNMLFGIFFIFMQNFSFTYAVYMLFGRVFPMKRMKIVFQK